MHNEGCDFKGTLCSFGVENWSSLTDFIRLNKIHDLS